MRLKDLLQENDAAEKAKSLGLVSARWGKWADKNGNIKAITKNGKLVLVSPKAASQEPKGVAKAEPVKPATMSKQQAGIEPKNKAPETQAMRDKQKQKKDSGAGAAGEDQESQPTVTPNIFHPLASDDPMRSVRTYSAHELSKMFPEWEDTGKLREEIVPGEKVEIFENQNQFDDIFFNRSRSVNPQYDAEREKKEHYVSVVAHSDAADQFVMWRNNLPTDAQLDLAEAQIWWQTCQSPWYGNEKDKAKYNGYINEICQKAPPVCKIPGPIKRGMRIGISQIKQFLGAFSIGKDMDLPPSGFTADGGGMAESFGHVYPKVGDKVVGVLIKLHPNKKGEIFGLHLSNSRPPKQMNSEQAAQFFHAIAEYGDEQEIIRYSGPKARVLDIKKCLVPETSPYGDPKKKNNVAVTYVIDMEEQGMEPVAALREAYESNDDYNKPRKNPTFEKEMNSKFNQTGKSAAEEAHDLGLVSKGGAYWADKDGNTVAKTVNDQLVKINSVDVLKTDYMKTKTGNQKGTNRGGFYKGDDDTHRYIKHYSDPSQAYCEKVTSTLYRDLNIGAPKTAVFKKDGGTSLASDIVDGFVNKNLGFDKKTANKILDGVAADILTANWDSVGLEFDNIVITPDGEVFRIDNGGSLLFRAQAGRKPEKVLDGIPEFNGFSDSAINPAYSAVMHKAGYNSIADMGERFVEQVRNIARLRHKMGNWRNYVNSIAPEMDNLDKERIIKMLDTRYVALLQKAVEIGKRSQQNEVQAKPFSTQTKKTSTRPAGSDPFDAESEFYKDVPGKQTHWNPKHLGM